ncbi:hypothetical protein RB653_002270 [Dictyostelium firmibasis]|uniref:Conditioned medium factor n=1 Tax=Dictyostelium firmibasis TaxID=79012 RepID=A0AAN7TQ94_9MYCE
MRLLLLLILIITISFSYGALTPKNLAGEPSEFSSFNIPNPMDVAQSSDSSLLGISMAKSQLKNTFEWSGIVPVDSDKEFTLTFFSSFPLTEFNIEASPKTPSLKSGEHQQQQHKFNNHHKYGKFFKSLHQTPTITNGSFGIDGATAPSISLTWEQPTVGDWNVLITASSSLRNNEKFKKMADDSTPQLLMLIQNPSDTHIYSYVSSYNSLFTGQKVSVLAMLHKKSEFLSKKTRPVNWKPSPLKLTDVSAEMVLGLPDGSKETIPMYDDGLHDDEQANDGIFGGYVNVSELGNYDLQVIYKGVQNGNSLVRSNQHLIPITSQYLELTGEVQSSQDGDANLNIFFIVTSANQTTVDQTPVHVYSEVYGTDSDGNKVAIAWVAGISTAQPIETSSTTFALSAVLNERWIAKVGATAPFFVKNVQISDLDTFIPLSNTSSTSNVKMIGEYKDVRTIEHTPALNVITKEMRDGKMPKELAERVGKSTGNGKLILTHGYCSEGVWPIEDFENSVEFQDFNQNRGNDEFAQILANFGAQFTDGFSLVAHSQGGNAALHLVTYYHSGLDLSQQLEGRIIQTMGTPYQGTALAGTWASIGSAVGVGCSSNDDLTVDGAALWLKSIPADKRAFVYYTTTQYDTGSLINYCNLASNAVLEWPNDGVVDNEHTPLEGATYLNNFKDWCHSDGMHSPQQTTNTEYNKEMSSNSVW